MDRVSALHQLRRGQLLAAAVPSTRDDCMAWVAVYPLELTSPHSREFLANNHVVVGDSAQRAYHVRCFEVARSLLAQEVWLAEPDLHNKLSLFAVEDEQLFDRLALVGVTPEMLRFADEVDYPL